ncbi:hypothetical protein JOM56_001306 [Amanita muscaria]
MPPCSHTHTTTAFSPRKTCSGRKRTNSALSDLNTGNDGPKPPKGKQQRKTSVVRANEDAEASARAANATNMTRTLLLATFIWWIIPGLLVKSGKKWDCTGTLPGLLVFYRGGVLAGNTAKLHQASTGTLPGLSGKVLAIYQDFTVITRYGNSIITDGFL